MKFFQQSSSMKLENGYNIDFPICYKSDVFMFYGFLATNEKYVVIQESYRNKWRKVKLELFSEKILENPKSDIGVIMKNLFFENSEGVRVQKKSSVTEKMVEPKVSHSHEYKGYIPEVWEMTSREEYH